jgi:hypothetical protein
VLAILARSSKRRQRAAIGGLASTITNLMRLITDPGELAELETLLREGLQLFAKANERKNIVFQETRAARFNHGSSARRHQSAPNLRDTRSARSGHARGARGDRRGGH